MTTNAKTRPVSLLSKDLPSLLQDFDLGAATTDANALFHIAECISGALQSVEAEAAAKNRLGSLAWLMRDMAEVLAWRLDQIELTHQLVKREPEEVPGTSV